ncbi:MAG: nucleotide exchange factor GrpE [Minisyncoccia bacterium]
MTDDRDKIIDGEEEFQEDPGDDVVYEENSEVTAPDLHAKLEKFRTRIKELEKKNSELLDSWQRDKADFINARKSDETTKQEFLKFAKADIISEIIPALDSFDNAMRNKESWENVDKNWRMGVEYIRTQLLTALQNHGLKVINPLGEMYNHARDEAVETVKVDSKDEDGKILDVMQVGYELNGKEVRPPKVRIGHFE